ncbi:hypothetical protein KY339_05240 [Candidatus Woesearchaeota archaeon]|nr:hypothetical protein [Candidatus Woesearchaeota archaeon]
MELGGNIVLNGFRELDGAQLIVVKKIVGNYARRMSDLCKKFENLSVTMKTVHAKERANKFELHAKLMDNGTPYNSEVTDFNLFFALDKVLAKLENSVS